MESLFTSVDAISRECENILEAMADHSSQEHYSMLEVRGPGLFLLICDGTVAKKARVMLLTVHSQMGVGGTEFCAANVHSAIALQAEGPRFHLWHLSLKALQ